MKSIDVCLTHQQLEKFNHIGKIVVIIDVEVIASIAL